MSKTIPLASHPATQPAVAQKPVGELPPLKITERRSLPSGIATNVKQHVVIVRDHSTSMSGSKIAELNQASQALITELANPENKDGFRVSVVDFNHVASRRTLAEQPLMKLLPTASASGGTSFQAALTETVATIEAQKQQPNPDGWTFLRPVVLFLSDGQSTAEPALIDSVQEMAQVVTIAYGSDADQATLRQIASDGQTHVVGTDGSSLRRFLSDVGKTLSQALQSQQ